MNCFSCNVQLPAWDKVCPECGKKQVELAELRRAEMELERQKAEELQNQYLFDEAIEIAKSVASETDIRLQHLKAWCERFLADIQKDIDEHRQRSENNLIEALAHEAVYDDDAGIRVIKLIPETLRGATLTIAGQSISPNEMLTRWNVHHGLAYGGGGKEGQRDATRSDD